MPHNKMNILPCGVFRRDIALKDGKTKSMLFYKKNCETCGKEMEAQRSAVLRGGGRYCSHSCHMKTRTGEKNANWRGGVSQHPHIHTRKQKNKFPEKCRARKIVRDAIHRGTMIRQPCEICGETKDVHAHHEDYSKPREVKWLCRPHHYKFHLERDGHPNAGKRNSKTGSLSNAGDEEPAQKSFA